MDYKNNIIESFKKSEKAYIEIVVICNNREKYVDPHSHFIAGNINFILYDHFIEESDFLEDIFGVIFLDKTEEYKLELEIWLDCDDYQSWYDYKLLNKEKL